MSVKLGINPMSWNGENHPAYLSSMSLDRCFCDTRQAGFRGTELGVRLPTDSACLRQVLDRHELEIASGWYDGQILDRDVDDEFEAMRPHLAVLRDFGAKCVAYADTSRTSRNAGSNPSVRRPRLDHDAWPEYGAKVTRLAERMRVFGVGMAFHPFMGTIIESDDDIETLMEHTGDAVGLLFDAGHSAISGGDPVTVLDQHARRVVHVHCKDVRLDILDRVRTEDLSFTDAKTAGVFTMPGDGAIPYDLLLPTLVNHGYEGWLVVEADQESCQTSLLSRATLGFQNLSAAAAAAGMSIEP